MNANGNHQIRSLVIIVAPQLQGKSPLTAAVRNPKGPNNFPNMPTEWKAIAIIPGNGPRPTAPTKRIATTINGMARMEAYPDLNHSGSHYSAAWEKRQWDWQRVLTHLAGYAVQRRVDSSGKIGLYGGKLYVGTIHKGRQVYIQFDPTRHEWIVSDPRGQQLRIIPATDIKPRAIRTLDLKPTWRK